MRSDRARGGLSAALVVASGLLLAGSLGAPTQAEDGPTVRVLRPIENGGAQLAQANPCAGRNPCGNPCAARNPCAGKNPCGANPCGGANPCAGARIDPARFQQPKDVALASGDRAALVAAGERLWNDAAIGKSGLACASCHVQDYALMNPTFAKPYPHFVEMVSQRTGVSQVNAAEMVNFCMVVPMADEPLAWNSRELAALTAYVEHIQPGYLPVGSAAGANPCAGTNPCGARNPCSGSR